MSSAEPATRERILEAACTLLAQGSAEAASMARIAKAAGLSRQAVYLHFASRAELLIAAARHVDLARDVDARLAASRAAETGEARLDAYIEAWGGYIPEVHAVAAALRAAQDGDDAARAAWSDRMEAMRHGCAAAVAALARDGDLTPALDEAAATDLLFALLSIEVWEHLARDRAWPQDRYIAEMKRTARAALMR